MVQLCSECTSSIKPKFNKTKKLQLKFTVLDPDSFIMILADTLSLVLSPNFNYML